MMLSLKPIIVTAVVAAPVAASASSQYEVAAACAGGAILSAMFKYREGARTQSKVAVADAVIAAVAGMTIGWFGHNAAISLLGKWVGISVSASLSALLMSFMGIKIAELLFAADISKYLPGGKKNA